MDRARLAVESLAAEQENLLTSCQVWKWKVSFDKKRVILFSFSTVHLGFYDLGFYELSRFTIQFEIP